MWVYYVGLLWFVFYVFFFSLFVVGVCSGVFLVVLSFVRDGGFVVCFV